MQYLRRTLRRIVRKLLFPAFGVQHIHIVGCARSGTTMLHYAMIAFHGVVLSKTESDIAHDPGLRQSLALLLRAVKTRKPVHYISKRNYAWHETENLRQTIRTALAEKVRVINLVRDPRDVLVSRHAGSDNQSSYYVPPERWASSVAAGEALLESIKHATPTLTVRYEDLVANSEYAETLIAQTFALRKHDRLQSIDKLSANVRALGVAVDMETALHKLRDFDKSSVQKWRNDDRSRAYVMALLQDDSPVAVTLHDFLWRHRYLPGAWSQDAREHWYAQIEAVGDSRRAGGARPST